MVDLCKCSLASLTDLFARRCDLAAVRAANGHLPKMTCTEKHMESFQKDLHILKIFSVVGTPDRNSWPDIHALPLSRDWPVLPRSEAFVGKLDRTLGRDGRDLVMSMLQCDPSKRPTAPDDIFS